MEIEVIDKEAVPGGRRLGKWSELKDKCYTLGMNEAVKVLMSSEDKNRIQIQLNKWTDGMDFKFKTRYRAIEEMLYIWKEPR